MGSTTVKEWYIIIVQDNQFVHSIQGDVLPGKIFNGIMIATTDSKQAQTIKGTRDHIDGFISGLKFVFGFQFVAVPKR
jgi:hypothetical protein